MNKTFKEVEAMERKELTQALLGGKTQQSQTQGGGEVMRRYLWSTIDASGRLVPYAVLECSEEIAEEIENRERYENKWMFIADRLHERYPEQFPEWWDDYGKRHAFWYNNVLESWEEAYERIKEERIRALRDSWDDEEGLEFEVERLADEELSSLPVFKIEGEGKEGFYWFYEVVYERDRYPEELYGLPVPTLISVEEFEGRRLETYRLSDKKALVRDTYDNGDPAWVFIGVETLNDKVWQTEYVFCLSACNNDMFWFVDL
jgi:hypothetical protein